MRAVAILAGVALLAGCGGGSPATPPDEMVVSTDDGAVRGTRAGDVRVFQGIPYAAPPTGALRWQPPVDPAPWRAVRAATEPGLRCIQDVRVDPDYGRPTSEDCLNLTVWTPDGARSDSPRPVMVWIHGGGFVNGSADIYDSRRLAARGDIVVVTLNYRLGALGFLAHPALAERPGSPPDPGNYGLADQQAALRWVRDNIDDFGGDPAKVTIAGQSAGAISVCDHLVAPESRGLFRAAIMQSGPCQVQATLPAAEQISIDYATGLGCADPASAARCLLDLPADRLLDGPPYVRIGAKALTGPVTGTQRLPGAPPELAARGATARVPVLIGSTADEFTLFVALSYLRTRTMGFYRTLLAEAFGDQAPAVATAYPLSSYGGSVGLAYAAAVGDGVFACPIEDLAADLARRAPVYAYEFNDGDAPVPDPIREAPFPVGAGHGLELRYLFDMGGAPALDPAQRALSDQMIGYWSRFVTTGTPDVAGQPEWAPLDPQRPQRMSLHAGAPAITADFADRHRCGFWASLG